MSKSGRKDERQRKRKRNRDGSSVNERSSFHQPSTEEGASANKTWIRQKRKRNRDGSSVDDRSSCHQQSTEEGASVNKKSIRQPFAGKLFAVSTLVENDGDVALPEANYKGLLALCQSGGAQFTSQVHKKVFCVVATKNAIQRQTQRVRKGWKKKKPVVKVDWVHKCLKAGRLLNFGDDEVWHTERAADGSHARKEDDESSTKEADGGLLKERKVDLGCCCVCHETGVTGCEWCKDCSVAQVASCD